MESLVSESLIGISSSSGSASEFEEQPEDDGVADTEAENLLPAEMIRESEHVFSVPSFAAEVKWPILEDAAASAVEVNVLEMALLSLSFSLV